MVVRPKSVRFDLLHKVMRDLGYESQRVDDHYVAFVRPGRDLFVVVRRISPEAEVKPIDLLSVQKTLMNEGLIESEQ